MLVCNYIYFFSVCMLVCTCVYLLCVLVARVSVLMHAYTIACVSEPYRQCFMLIT